MDDQLALRNLSLIFRSAILASIGDLPEEFADFPEGACGDSCSLLARFLGEKGYGGWIYVYGWRQDADQRSRSHAWLERGDLIVDITADQFAEVSDPAIVTTDQSWHSQFEVEPGNPGRTRL